VKKYSRAFLCTLLWLWWTFKLSWASFSYSGIASLRAQGSVTSLWDCESTPQLLGQRFCEQKPKIPWAASIFFHYISCLVDRRFWLFLLLCRTMALNWGMIFVPKGHFPIFGDIFDCHDWDIGWLEARILLNILYCIEQPLLPPKRVNQSKMPMVWRLEKTWYGTRIQAPECLPLVLSESQTFLLTQTIFSFYSARICSKIQKQFTGDSPTMMYCAATGPKQPGQVSVDWNCRNCEPPAFPLCKLIYLRSVVMVVEIWLTQSVKVVLDLNL
jgi:hypothetical protein